MSYPPIPPDQRPGPWGHVAVDHLVFAAPDLSQGIEHVEDLLGVTVSPGGRHPQWGTRNVLVPLEDRIFLEVIAPDPEAEHGPVTLFGIDRLTEPRLVTWVARCGALADQVSRAHGVDLDMGAILSGRRKREDGTEISWQLTDPMARREGGVIPFLIDWGNTPHPTEGTEPRCALRGLRLLHPEEPRVTAGLRALGIGVGVALDERPEIRATLDTPAGRVVLQ